MCITGATIGVGLCARLQRSVPADRAGNWDFKAVNWRAIGWSAWTRQITADCLVYVGWILTIPIVGILAGCLFAFIARSRASSEAVGAG